MHKFREPSRIRACIFEASAENLERLSPRFSVATGCCWKYGSSMLSVHEPVSRDRSTLDAFEQDESMWNQSLRGVFDAAIQFFTVFSGRIPVYVEDGSRALPD